MLDPEVVLRADGGQARARVSAVIQGARDVARQAVLSRRLVPFARPVLINGAAGIVAVAGDRVIAVMAFTVVDAAIVSIDVLLDPDRLATLPR